MLLYEMRVRGAINIDPKMTGTLQELCNTRVVGIMPATHTSYKLAGEETSSEVRSLAQFSMAAEPHHLFNVNYSKSLLSLTRVP